MTTFREHLKPRFAALGIIVLLVLGVLFVRLWSMQVLGGSAFAAQADSNRIREITLEAPRGRILDRNGIELVTNRATMAVVVDRSAAEDTEMLNRLSALLDVPVAEIKERVESERESALKPRTVAIDVSRNKIAYLAEHEVQFPGVDIEVQAVRNYPQGSLAAHVLGYSGGVSEKELETEKDFGAYHPGDIVGKSGAERQFETALQGDRGYRRIEVDATGRPRRVIEEAAPIAGRDVVLTIDSRLQKATEEALAQAMKDAHAEDYPKAQAGAAVLVDTVTGEVLAMASAPTYDPSVFLGGISQKDWDRLTRKGSEYPLNNRAIMAGYPPASTFKVVTGLAGLETGVARGGSTYVCEGKWIGMGEQWKKYCWKRTGHGTETFMDGITDSCDTVFYEIGHDFYQRGKEELQAHARLFGYGEKSGIDLPGEISGRVPDAEWKAEYNADYPEFRKWLPGDTVNMAIGQGDMLATPLQVVMSYAGVANGGKVMRPHVLKEVLGSSGETALVATPTVGFDTKFSAANVTRMKNALVNVTTDGTAKSAFRGFEVTVAGKTGTAEVAGKDDYAWFTGFAPANNPRYAVVVVIEQGGHGGSVAAPAARNILATALGQPVRHIRAQDDSR